MIGFLRLDLALTICLAGAASAAQEGQVTQSRDVDARVLRVKLEGLVDLKLRHGAAASLVISGDRELMARSVTEVEGDTITIGTEGRVLRMARRQLLRAELTLPQLREVSSESLGMADIEGFSGDELDLKLDGAGAIKVQCSYRVLNASLGGVGSMELQGTFEGIDVQLPGAGMVSLRGSSKWIKASLDGLGGLDARQLAADSVRLELSGLGNASVWARQAVELELSGLGSVTVHGKPVTRRVNVSGLGKVNWK